MSSESPRNDDVNSLAADDERCSIAIMVKHLLLKIHLLPVLDRIDLVGEISKDYSTE